MGSHYGKQQIASFATTGYVLSKRKYHRLVYTRAPTVCKSVENTYTTLRREEQAFLEGWSAVFIVKLTGVIGRNRAFHKLGAIGNVDIRGFTKCKKKKLTGVTFLLLEFLFSLSKSLWCKYCQFRLFLWKLDCESITQYSSKLTLTSKLLWTYLWKISYKELSIESLDVD